MAILIEAAVAFSCPGVSRPPEAFHDHKSAISVIAVQAEERALKKRVQGSKQGVAAAVGASGLQRSRIARSTGSSPALGAPAAAAAAALEGSPTRRGAGAQRKVGQLKSTGQQVMPGCLQKSL